MPGYISDTDIDRIREATDIVELVREYLPLKRSGSSFKALCPFHQEKTPSFHVVPAKQLYKCFGCGAAGDVFSFVMKHEGIGFSEALKILADRSGIPIETETTAQRTQRSVKDKIHEANQWAARLFFEQLKKSQQAEQARKYLAERGISDEMANKFGLGYSSPDWDSLLKKAEAQQKDLSILEQAGLLMLREKGGYYDRFRGRLMFPIIDARGRIQGFGARALDDSEPKYLNSPETPVFNKSNSLYGIHIASKSMLKGTRALVVEGYTDVIMAHQHGFDTAVAVLGTALTRDHVRLLKRYSEGAVLMLDQDDAGQASTERSLDAFVTEEMEVAVGSLPSGKDPCDFLVAHGRDPFEQSLEKSIGAIEFKVNRAQSKEGGLDKPGALDDTLSTVKLISDPVARESAIRDIARLTGISEVSLQGRISQIRDSGARRTVAKAAEIRRDPQRELLQLILTDSDCLEKARLGLDKHWVTEPLVMSLIRKTFEMYEETGEVEVVKLLSRCRSEKERSLVEAVIGSDNGKTAVEENVLWCEQLLTRLRALHVERLASALENKLRSATSDEEKMTLLAEMRELRRNGQRKIGFAKSLIRQRGR